MAAAIIGTAIQAGGKGARGAGSVEANKAEAQRKADLEATAKKLGITLRPLGETITSGLAPGGALRDTLASPGLTRAEQRSRDSLSLARSLGTRTSARAQEKGFDALFQNMLERAGVRGEADITADTELANIGLDELGLSEQFNTLPARNQLAFAGSALESFGGQVAQADFGESPAANTYTTAYDATPITGPDGRVVAI